MGRAGLRGQECRFGRVKLKMPVRHPSGDAEWTIGYMSPEFRGGIQARDVKRPS